MLAIKPDKHGVIEIYPHNNKKRIRYHARFTIIHNRIYYNGNEWTAEKIQHEKERVLELEAAFNVAQMVVEAERVKVGS